MPKQHLSLAEVMENFHTFNKTQKSDQTCLWYERRLGAFLAWLRDEIGCEPALADFSLEMGIVTLTHWRVIGAIAYDSAVHQPVALYKRHRLCTKTRFGQTYRDRQMCTPR